MRILAPIDRGKFGGVPQFVEIRSNGHYCFVSKPLDHVQFYLLYMGNHIKFENIIYE